MNTPSPEKLCRGRVPVLLPRGQGLCSMPCFPDGTVAFECAAWEWFTNHVSAAAKLEHGA